MQVWQNGTRNYTELRVRFPAGGTTARHPSKPWSLFPRVSCKALERRGRCATHDGT
jgi:hypothetical protein